MYVYNKKARRRARQQNFLIETHDNLGVIMSRSHNVITIIPADMSDHKQRRWFYKNRK